MKKNIPFYLCLITLIISFFTITANASELSNKLKGKILLQVEQNGEAWYMNPANEERYFMGRPDDAFSLMRALGVGISNNDLQKIQIADINLSGVDDDNDGLSNMIEDSIGTDKNKNDSDNDGYSDKDEILNSYNPNGAGKLNIDSNFANDQSGKILLQVEQNGEAWYVNPGDKKRYFLGRPADAFSVMRSLGLGITDSNLSQITQNESNKNSQNLSQIAECAEFPDKLDSCSEYTCTFTHMLTGDEMTREIKGIVNGKCLYTEEMPNDGRMDCEYTESMRKAAAQYYINVVAAKSIGTSVNTDLGSDDVKTTYTINGKEVENPLQEALDSGQCVVSGYGDDDNDNCPSGTTYEGELYSYENDGQIAHPVCSDPNMICPTCENCSSGVFKKVMKIVDGTGQEVCQECLFNSDCKDGYYCFDDNCISNDVLIENTKSCDNSCANYSCENCKSGYMFCKTGWSNWPSDMKNKCIECDDRFDSECLDGYKCEAYKCVVE